MCSREIIPIEHGIIGKVPQFIVDARTLHATLKVKRDFSNWIKGRIFKYGFVEGEDFEKSSISSSSPNLASGDSKGLQKAIEYHLSLNMGKELAMVENNNIGRMVRRYFIECERKALESFCSPHPASLSPFLQIKTLPRVQRERLNELVLSKIAHIPPHLVWKTRMSVWAAFNRRFCIPRYCLLPEARMSEAVLFLSELEIGPQGKVKIKANQYQFSKKVDEIQEITNALSSLVNRAQEILKLNGVEA